MKIPEINAVEIKKLPRKIKSKLHPKWKQVLTSRAVRRANPTGLVKREICRPPSKPPDRQNSLNYKHETKKGREKPYKKGKTRNPKCRGRRDRCPKDRQGTKLQAPSKATLYTKCQWRSNRIIENIVPKTRPLKPPRIHSSVVREGIDQEKECLLKTVLNHRPPPKPPPKSL